MNWRAMNTEPGKKHVATRRGRRTRSAQRVARCAPWHRLAGVAIATALLTLGACSDSSDNSSSAAIPPGEYAVGSTERTFVDTSRVTAAHGGVPEAPSRTLETTLYFPAEGATGAGVLQGAPVDGRGAPFPLVVLSHGLGGTVAGLLPLAEAWASAGYVVALPRFPLTNFATPGGPDANDVQNQPGDVSFIIDEVLAESSASGRLLSDAVDGDRLAASGHSNGGITTYGLIANTCCRDDRIDAAIILSGVLSPSFGEGEYVLADMPPILVVHGINDVQLLYNQAVRSYNEFEPPKGFLSLEASDHGSYLRPEVDPAFDVVSQATRDFLDGELRGDGAALDRLPSYQVPGVAALSWAPDEASNVPVELLPEPETNRQASLSTQHDLLDGQSITVTWSGFLPGQVVNVLQCAGDGFGGAPSCDIARGRILFPNPTGMGSLELVVHTGPIGNGFCDSTNPCTVIVNDAGLTEEEAILRIPITFAE